MSNLGDSLQSLADNLNRVTNGPPGTEGFQEIGNEVLAIVLEHFVIGVLIDYTSS